MKKLIVLSAVAMFVVTAFAFNWAKAVPVGSPRCAAGTSYVQLYVSSTLSGVWCATPFQIATAKANL